MARKPIRKAKSKTTKGQKKTNLTIGDYIFPGERGSYWTGVAGTALIFIWLAAAAWLMAPTPKKNFIHIPIELILYPIIAFVITNILATKPRQDQIKKMGLQNRVTTNNHGELLPVLDRLSSVLGLSKTPVMYVVDDKMPIIFSFSGARGTIIASQSLIDAVNPDEFAALLAHEITHIKCKHTRMDLALMFIRSSTLPVQILLSPVWIFMFLSQAWPHLIDFTADRGAFLCTLKPALVNAALVKFAVAQDPQAGISREELQAFLEGSGDIHTDTLQLQRHFKVGQYVTSHKDLKDRIEELTAYPQSAQGQTALGKLSALAGVSIETLMPTRTGRAEDEIETVDDGQDIPMP